MEGSKKMLVGLLLVIAAALPAAMAYSSSFEKDFIIPETVEAVLKRKAPLSNMMMEDEDAVLKIISSTKTIISNPVLEEAFLNNFTSANGVPCGESFVWIPCFSSAFGCTCKSKVCYRNSLLDHKY